MIFSQAKLIGGGIAVVFIGALVWAGYTYVTNLQDTVEFQAKEITKLEISNQSLEAQHAQLESDLEENKEHQIVLNGELRDARQDKDDLVKLFSDHDFTNLVNKKPGLIEKLINKGTDKVFKELEDISDE